MSHDTKIKVTFILMIAGMLWWTFSGHEIITTSPDFKEFLGENRGGGFFSLGSLIIAVSFFSAWSYPPIIWMLVCLEIAERGSAKEILFSGESWYLWLAPLAILLFFCLLIVLRIVSSVAIWTLYIGGPIFLFVRWIGSNVKRGQNHPN